MNFLKIKSWSSTRLLSVGFALIILFGTVLLSLPISSRSGNGLGLLDAAFTAASATCVTGLALFDTYTQFTVFGQVVILLLIQVGGLGFMTVAIFFSLAVHRRIGLRERSLLADGVGSLHLAGVVRMVRRILFGTVVFEGLGTVLLAIRFVPRFGFLRGLWTACFHAVSAFCNAGFDLMGRLQPSSSLTFFYDDPLVVLTIAALIVIGGIGFVVWNDFADCAFHLRKLNYHSKVVITSTLALIAVGAALFFWMEKDASMAGMDMGGRLLSSLFQSVTPRTAGFNTVDTASLSDGGKALTMLLMFIGAAPGGTGGGIKITTFVVIAATAYASLKNKNNTNVGHYCIRVETIGRAFCSVTVYIGITLAGILVLCTQGVALTDAAFECISAIGTVGLSTGVTASLTEVSKLAVILLMYIGRLGSLTVFLAVSGRDAKAGFRYPIGKLLVG
ncbi:Ktr system potassium uptake protein KtrB [Oscillibacter valericigenes Sjm18-20]|nr:Ktr system potassium uptake protein KtrB [Oscillibacter valericigenes Sjm18-20]